MIAMEEKIDQVVDALLKEFAPEVKSLEIVDSFRVRTSSRFQGFHHIFQNRFAEVDFGELSDRDFWELTCKIADEICSRVSSSETEIFQKEVTEKSEWTHWGRHTYDIARRVLIFRPCRSFLALNKKLEFSGLKKIDFKDWYFCDIEGKRSSIFSRRYTWFAESEEICSKVLAFLKGKRKFSYNFTEHEDLSDRDRGEMYETEWHGHKYRKICFADSQGKTEIF